MTDQEIRAKALECAIATIAALPEALRNAQIASCVAHNQEPPDVALIMDKQYEHYIANSAKS